MRTKKKLPSALSIAAVLLCLVLVTAHFTSGMYARFVTSAGANGNGRAAEFDVSATQNLAEVKASEDGYQITFTNNSNVPVTYEAVIRFDDDADAARFSALPPITGELEPGKTVTTEPFTFEFVGTDGSGEAPFSVIVTFTQID